MKSIGKALDALRLFAEPPHEASVADVARRLGATASTASRILATLRDGELLDQDPVTRRYRPGALSLQLAGGFRRTTDTLACVQAAMPEIVAASGHTAWAGVLDGGDVVILRTLHGGFPVRFSVDLGGRLPAHAAAMGKALLALLPDAEVRRRCAGALAARTARTLRTPKALLADLAAIRARGFATSDQELFQGIRSISVAFQGPGTDGAVGLSLSYPLFSVAEADEKRLVATLLDHGRRIGLRVGDPRWSAPPT